MKNPFALRAKWYRTLHMASAWYALAKMDDDKFTWKDAPETVALAAGLTWVWWDVAAASLALSTTPLVVVEAAVVTGLVASVAIGGIEGGETYVDYLTNPTEMITDRKKKESLMQASEITMGVVAPHLWLGGKIIDYGTEEIWKYKDELFKNRWKNPIPLPF